MILLTSPTASATSTTTATASVTTNTGSGVAYFVVTESSTAPTDIQVKAGLDEFGAAAAGSGSSAVILAPGVVNFIDTSGLTPATNYFYHFVQEQGGAPGVFSAVVSSPMFTTFSLTTDTKIISLTTKANRTISSDSLADRTIEHDVDASRSVSSDLATSRTMTQDVSASRTISGDTCR